jgi:drug/metabolite transporter (DMT)-like permease
LLWMAASGALFSLLNALLRSLSLRISPFQTLALVYGSTLVMMLPLVLRGGATHLRPRRLAGLLVRGAVHWLGMCLWMVAVTAITLAETTAIGFTTPLFIMGGAALLLKEPFHWERGVATAVGFAGVLVVAGPRLTSVGGGHSLLMLGSAVVFAASFLLSKRLTRHDDPFVIVLWQSIAVTLLSLPLAWWYWRTPATGDLWIAALCGLLAAVGNYCLTRAFATADISSSQPAKFLDLVWASILGWLVFGDRLEQSTLAGGLMILLATIWVARRETGRY